MNGAKCWAQFFIYRLYSNHHLNFKAMAASVAALSTTSTNSQKGNGLLLYYNKYSFYAQKVVMAMAEKKLPFKPHIVNIISGEQYQPKFLEINPRGEVPVLVDGVKVIPDSARIIDYLEDNFSNGNTPRLIPSDQGSQVRQKVEHFRRLIDPLPANVITMGSFLHPEFSPNPKLPFIAPVRKQLLKSDEKASQTMLSLAEKYPNYKDVFLKKAEAHDHNRAKIISKEGYENLLKEVDAVLIEVEKQLATHKGDKTKWLCTDTFTIADIGLTILLERLHLLGLGPYFWTEGKKPFIAEYYERVKKRDSYKTTIPTSKTHLQSFLAQQSRLFVYVSVAALIAVTYTGVKYYKNK